MSLYLLVPVLLLHGVMESQTAKEQLSNADGKDTLSVSQMWNITMNPENVTLSLHKRQIEDELQKNGTSVVTEEDENFQDVENHFSAQECYHHLLIDYSQDICVSNFHTEMQKISKDDWCVMDSIIRPYNDVTDCLELVSQFSNCFYPNPEVQDVFVHIHASYFHNCSTEEPPLEDAPQGVVIFLTLVPVSIIPAMVYLVVWKSKVQD